MRRLGRSRTAVVAAGLITATLAMSVPAGATAGSERASAGRDAAPPGGRTVYVTNSATPRTPPEGPANVTRFTVDDFGRLAPVDTVDVGEEAGARSMVFTPDLRFAYLANTFANEVVMFQIKPDGALERFGTVATPGPWAMAIAPDGETVYVGNQNTRTVSLFEVGDKGELTPRGVPVDTGVENTKGVAVTPDGRFLYVSHGVPTDAERTEMTGFALRPDGSVKKEVAREEIGISGAETVITPDGRFVYVANQGSDDVSGFRIGEYGGLTAVPGSPFDGGDFPEGAAISPDGRRLYVAAVGVSDDGDTDAIAGEVVGFTIGNDGRLIENIDRVEMSSPIGIGFTPDGRHAYVSDFTESIVNAFAVAPDGNLRLIQTAKSGGPRPALHSVNVPPAGYPGARR